MKQPRTVLVFLRLGQSNSTWQATTHDRQEVKYEDKKISAFFILFRESTAKNYQSGSRIALDRDFRNGKKHQIDPVGIPKRYHLKQRPELQK